MQFYSIPVKAFRQRFYQAATFMVSGILVTFGLLYGNVHLLYRVQFGYPFALVVLLAMVMLVFVYSIYRKRKLQQLLQLETFDAQAAAYERVYLLTLWWHLLSCLVSCALAFLTAREVFLYFPIFDFIVMLRFYPKTRLFRTELKNEEIILSE